MLDFLLRADSPDKLPVFPLELFGFGAKPAPERPAPSKTLPARSIGKRLDAYCRKPIDEVVDAADGSRNSTLNKVAYGLFQRISGHENELPADYLAGIWGHGCESFPHSFGFDVERFGGVFRVWRRRFGDAPAQFD